MRQLKKGNKMQTKTITARVPIELHSRVIELASERGDSVNQVARDIIEKHFKSLEIDKQIREMKSALEVSEKRTQSMLSDHLASVIHEINNI